MKKDFTLLLSAAMVLASASASAGVWNTTAADNLLVSGAEAVGQDLPLSAPGPDGSTYVAWLSWEDGNANLKLQLIGADGEFLLGADGKYVSKFPTPTWSSGYDVCTDADGNLLIVYADKRNDVWQAYVYKVSPTGEMLWNDGVAVAADRQETCLNPKLITTDKGNTVVAYQSLNGQRNTIKIAKLTSEGTKAWGGVITLTGTNGLYNLVPAENDSFYIDYMLGDRGKLAVMRYTANGEAAWDEPAYVDPGKAVVSTEPLAASDSQGGILVSWRYAPSSYEVMGAMQGVDRDGNLLWPEFEMFPNVPVPYADAEGYIYAGYSESNPQGLQNLHLCRYNPEGDLLWDTNQLIAGGCLQVSIYGVHAVDGESVAVYRKASSYNEATIEMGHVDAKGKNIETDVTLSVRPGDKGRGCLTPAGNRELVLTWGDNGMADGKGSIYAQNVSLATPAGVADATLGRSSLTAYYTGNAVAIEGATGIATLYDLSGATVCSGSIADGQLATGSLAPGFYLLEANSNTAKIIVK